MVRAAGIPPAALDFLRGLAANNEKAWFEANRDAYEGAVREPMAALIGDVSAELSRLGLPLEGEARRSAFRIHRDVRFSKDKSPYKTEVGAVWYRQGSGKDGAGVLYFHLAPGGCFTAAAFYRPEPETLGAIRERIRVHPDQFLAVEAGLADAGLRLDAADALRRMPRGFEDLQDSPVAAALRLRSFIVRRELLAKQVQGPALVPTIVDMAADALPLLRFGWAAVDEVREPPPSPADGRGRRA
ncbi:MAG: DUF2461 domain-containing protein [Acetobacteraceae bacterium]